MQPPEQQFEGLEPHAPPSATHEQTPVVKQVPAQQTEGFCGVHGPPLPTQHVPSSHVSGALHVPQLPLQPSGPHSLPAHCGTHIVVVVLVVVVVGGAPSIVGTQRVLTLNFVNVRLPN